MFSIILKHGIEVILIRFEYDVFVVFRPLIFNSIPFLYIFVYYTL